MSNRPLIAKIATLFLVIFISGCTNKPPTGYSGTRIAPTDRTRAEEYSRSVTNESLVLFAESAAEKLVRDLAERSIYGISDSDYVVTIIIGDILNKTQGRVQTQDFEMVVTRMRSKLLTSGMVRNNIRFQRKRSRLERNRTRERGTGSSDPLQRRGNHELGSRQSNPDYTFFLDGNMFARASVTPVRYYLNFELVRESDGSIVWAHEYEENRR